MAKGSKKKATKRKTTRGPAQQSAKKAGSSPSLRKLSTGKVMAEIHRRRDVLVAQRAEIDEELALIDGLGGSAPAKRTTPQAGKARRGRPSRKSRSPREGSLPDVIAAVLNGYEMTIAEVVKSVKKRGYKSKAKNFSQIVSMRLSQDKQFKRVSRGVYTLAR